jgi:DNA replication and repair protein RecF
MALLERIVVQDFRNIALAELEFSPNINCISGNNGEGKTNIMDAIWYLSMTKSYFSSSDRYNYRHGTEGFSLLGTYRMPDGLTSKISIQVGSDGSKQIRRDDKPYKKVAEHIGLIPIVMVSPSDISLVSESGEGRRRFANSVLSQTDRNYLYDMQQYNRLLAQRNRMLKDGTVDQNLLDVFDGKMEAPAQRIYEARKHFAEQMSPIVAEYYKSLSGGQEEISITYRSDLSKGSLSSQLAGCRERDMMMKYTTAGIQRDDFLFWMDGFPIRNCGSQGQQKSFLVSLKFAQYDIMKQGYGFAPILLLDDVFDKLDMGRIQNMLGIVAGRSFGQIFITDSNKVRMSGIVDNITRDRAYFEAVGGNFTKLEV